MDGRARLIALIEDDQTLIDLHGPEVTAALAQRIADKVFRRWHLIARDIRPLQQPPLHVKPWSCIEPLCACHRRPYREEAARPHTPVILPEN